MTLWLINSVFALSDGVPELDGLITGSRHNLTVVHREGNGQDILGVSQEATSCGSCVHIPKTKSSIPGSRQAELSIRGNHNVLDKVRVTTKGPAGISILSFLAGQVPDNNSLISAS